MKSTSTIKVVDKLIKQSSVFGNSGHRIVSDQDSVFTLHDFKEYYKDEATEHVTHCCRCVSRECQIERVNRILQYHS